MDGEFLKPEYYVKIYHAAMKLQRYVKGDIRDALMKARRDNMENSNYGEKVLEIIVFDE